MDFGQHLHNAHPASALSDLKSWRISLPELYVDPLEVVTCDRRVQEGVQSYEDFRLEEEDTFKSESFI